MTYDVIIIGAGQQGLACAYYLKKQKLSFLILEQNKQVGDNWRNHYDSLVLFTQKLFNSLPKLKFPGKPFDYANKNDMANYLELYAKHFNFLIRNNEKVITVEKEVDLFSITTNSGKNFKCKKLVITTGSFDKPFIPNLPRDGMERFLYEIHSKNYHNPTQFSGCKNVLVVGAGNSGAQIAIELSKFYNVSISSGRIISSIPKKFFNFVCFLGWLFYPLLFLKSDSFLGKFFLIYGENKKKTFLVGVNLNDYIKKNIIKIYPRAKSIIDRTVYFQDGKSDKFDGILWATGGRFDLSFLMSDDIIKNNINKNLFISGEIQSRTIGSGFVIGSSLDAKYITQKIVNSLTENK